VSAGWDYFDTEEVGFKELYQLFNLVTNKLGQKPVVIDADDLLKQPGLYLSINVLIWHQTFCVGPT